MFVAAGRDAWTVRKACVGVLRGGVKARAGRRPSRCACLSVRGAFSPPLFSYADVGKEDACID